MKPQAVPFLDSLFSRVALAAMDSLGHIFAPPILIMTAAMLLTGILMAQVWYYASTYQQDSLWIKSVVYTVCAIEICHSCVALHIQYHYVLVISQSHVIDISWSIGVSIFLEVLAVVLVQGFYIYRIWQFGHSRSTTALLASILFCRSVFGLATALMTYLYDNFLAYMNDHATRIVANIGLSLSVIIDILTPALFIFFLQRQRSPVQQTRNIVRLLAFYTINTGAIAIMFSVATLFSFNFHDTNLVFSGLIIVLGKVYANSLLALLNTRQRLRNLTSNTVYAIQMNAGGHRNTCRTFSLALTNLPRDMDATAADSFVQSTTMDGDMDEASDGSSIKNNHYSLV